MSHSDDTGTFACAEDYAARGNVSRAMLAGVMKSATANKTTLMAGSFFASMADDEISRLDDESGNVADITVII